jgi:hypothetical protein
MAKPHWLRPGGKTKTPQVVVSFDTETEFTTRDGAEVLTLRCWDACLRYRAKDAGGEDFTEDWSGETPRELAATLEAAAGITGEAWCFAHNAGFDLTVTSLPMVLAELGWEPDFVNIGDETCVFAMSWAGQKIIITDTWSWLRCSLETAAKDVGMRKVKLPENVDTLEAWHHRCRHDVQILDQLLAELLDWWDGAQVGSFGVTGASCGWRTLRARVPAKTVLVGVEQPRTRLERQAIFGGRKEVWQVGRIRNRWVEDWDLAAAHLTTMAALPLPASPIDARNWTPPPSAVAPPSGLGAVVTVEITTRVPCAPLRVGDDVWWPVGTFRTVLTTPELAEVLKDADKVTILTAQWYRMTDAMTEWGQWCLELMAQPDNVVPRVVKRVAKGWGRAVPGRFALRTSKLIREAPALNLGWALEQGYDLDTGESLETLTYGGIARTYRKDQDGSDVSPVVLAFVEGYVRAAMAQIIRDRPPGELLQCNTDGWWEIRPGRTASNAAESVPGPYRAVRKAVSRDVTVIGPNHMDSLGDRRLAGVPKDAKQSLDGAYRWQDWPGLRWQLQFSRPGEYLRPGRELRLANHYCRRWVLTSGETVPVSVVTSPAGVASLLPWSQTSGRRPSDVLAEWQVPALQELADVESPWAYAGDASDPHLPGRQLPPPPGA